MRKLLIAGLAVASLTGIAYAQAGQRTDDEIFRRMVERLRELRNNPPTCVDANGVARKVEETSTIDRFQFRCVETYGDGMKSIGANWIQVAPAAADYRYLSID